MLSKRAQNSATTQHSSTTALDLIWAWLYFTYISRNGLKHRKTLFLQLWLCGKFISWCFSDTPRIGDQGESFFCSNFKKSSLMGNSFFWIYARLFLILCHCIKMEIKFFNKSAGSAPVWVETILLLRTPNKPFIKPLNHLKNDTKLKTQTFFSWIVDMLEVFTGNIIYF